MKLAEACRLRPAFPGHHTISGWGTTDSMRTKRGTLLLLTFIKHLFKVYKSGVLDFVKKDDRYARHRQLQEGRPAVRLLNRDGIALDKRSIFCWPHSAPFHRARSIIFPAHLVLHVHTLIRIIFVEPDHHLRQGLRGIEAHQRPSITGSEEQSKLNTFVLNPIKAPSSHGQEEPSGPRRPQRHGCR